MLQKLFLHESDDNFSRDSFRSQQTKYRLSFDWPMLWDYVQYARLLMIL